VGYPPREACHVFCSLFFGVSGDWGWRAAELTGAKARGSSELSGWRWRWRCMAGLFRMASTVVGKLQFAWTTSCLEV